MPCRHLKLEVGPTVFQQTIQQFRETSTDLRGPHVRLRKRYETGTPHFWYGVFSLRFLMQSSVCYPALSTSTSHHNRLCISRLYVFESPRAA